MRPKIYDKMVITFFVLGVITFIWGLMRLLDQNRKEGVIDVLLLVGCIIAFVIFYSPCKDCADEMFEKHFGKALEIAGAILCLIIIVFGVVSVVFPGLSYRQAWLLLVGIYEIAIGWNFRKLERE